MSDPHGARPSPSRIAVAGAGIIGLSCAFELARRGHDVTVFDPAGQAASTSWAAAGMIAPAYEVMLHGGGADTPMARLCFESAGLWPDFAKALSETSGLPIGYSARPTLALARNEDETARLETLAGDLERTGRRARFLDPVVLRQTHGISAAVEVALELPDDHQIDNRRLLQSLHGRGGLFAVRREAVNGATALRRNGFDAIVWARGAQERGVDRLVKGQALALEPVPGVTPQQVLRFGSGYIVPKPDRIVIGATSEEDYLHAGVSDTATATLLEAAIEILPGLSRADRLEVWTGLRPKRRDGTPMIGRVGPEEYVAAAHFRNGILLAPATARRIADMIEGREDSPDAGVFAPAASGATA